MNCKENRNRPNNSEPLKRNVLFLKLNDKKIKSEELGHRKIEKNLINKKK